MRSCTLAASPYSAQCLNNRFTDNSICRYFRWVDSKGRFVTGRRSTGQDSSSVFTSSSSMSDSPSTTNSGLTQIVPLKAKTNSLPCRDPSQGGCTRPAQKSCVHSNLCPQCCQREALKTGKRCSLKTHRTTVGTTAPLANVDSQIVANLAGQPQANTWARNLPTPIYDLVRHQHQISNEAATSHPEASEAARHVAHSITIYTWSSVFLFLLLWYLWR